MYIEELESLYPTECEFFAKMCFDGFAPLL